MILHTNDKITNLVRPQHVRFIRGRSVTRWSRWRFGRLGLLAVRHRYPTEKQGDS
jgi:hypothetical protein